LFNSILVICTGNICRSPYADAKLRSMMLDRRIVSAGVATNTSQLEGYPAAPLAVKVAADMGLDISSHRAKQVTQQLVEEFDLILAMERNQLDKLCEMHPNARHKVFLLGHWIGLSTIEDPYQKNEAVFRQVFINIDRAAEAWARRINDSPL
jgi:protein-tyrosine phosphatase